MKHFMLIALLILVACAPSTQSTSSIQTEIAQIEATLRATSIVETVIITATTEPSITREVENPTLTNTPAILGKIISDNINLRSEPSINSSILETLFKGEQIIILGVSKDQKWVHVISSIGYQGWVSVNLIKSRVEISGFPIANGTSQTQTIEITPTMTSTPTITGTFTQTATIFPTSTQRPFPTITPPPTKIPTQSNLCISWKNAGEYLNQFKCVEGYVYKVYLSGTTFFIDFDATFTSFYGVSFNNRWDNTLVGKCIHLTGTIVPYKGRPEIIINNPDQVQFCE